MTKMPLQKPGKSVQAVKTPLGFLHAVCNRLGIVNFGVDLAADETNTCAPHWLDESMDALTKAWSKEADGEWAWLNPPYAKIAPWVAKAWAESRKGAKIAVLVPASTGSNWWWSNVDHKAYATYLNGRITFEGHTTPYPKDLALLLYAPFLEGGSCVWNWKRQ